MMFSFKHAGLLIGTVSFFCSFLFAGRQQETYFVLLLAGLAMASISYVTILFGKESQKTKLAWTAGVICCAALHTLIEPFLVDTSYRFFISKNRPTLTELNEILRHKSGKITIFNDTILVKSDALTSREKEKLIAGKQALGVYTIFKSQKGIYYGLWGFLDVRCGITYLENKEPPGGSYKHLEGNWYR